MSKDYKTQKTKDTSLTAAQKGMRFLGMFHYLFGIFLIVMIVFLCIGGPEVVGAGIRGRNSDLLPFLNKYDDWVYGMSVITILFLQMVIELFLGWSCRRKSTRPEKLLLTLVLSGARILTSSYSLLKSGKDINILMDVGYTLLLNLLTFLLTFRIRREHGGILKKKY